MIMTRTRRALLGFLAAVMLCLCTAGAAWAVAESEISFSQSGDAIDVTLDGKGTDVSAFSLIMDVDVNADAPDAVQVSFQFSDHVLNNTSIHEPSYSTAGDKTRITLYVAGGHDLFAAPFQVGRIALGLDTAMSSGAEVIVDVPVMDEGVAEGSDGADAVDQVGVYALHTVTSARADDAAGVYLSEPFAAYLGDWRADGDPEPTPPGGNDGQDPTPTPGGDEDPIMGPDDGGDPNGQPQRNIQYGGDLSRTGDPLVPVVVSLLCVVAAALCVMGFLVIKRRKRS